MTARQSVGCVHRDIMDKPGQLTKTLSANTTHPESLWWTSCSKSKTQSFPELQLTWISQTSCCGLSTLCDWLQAPLITAVGLGLSDEATRVAVADRLGSKACELDTCVWGKAVDARGLHWLSYGTGDLRQQRYSHLNDILWRAIKRAQMPPRGTRWVMEAVHIRCVNRNESSHILSHTYDRSVAMSHH